MFRCTQYRETLDIHLREKHGGVDEDPGVVDGLDSAAGEVAAAGCCRYCAGSAGPHPRLARGETYACGYKPYRCDVCLYSTTTKGNLSIHTQSDRHLNNVHVSRSTVRSAPSYRRRCQFLSRRLYILRWSKLSRRKLSPTLATPTTLVLTTLVAQCELSGR